MSVVVDMVLNFLQGSDVSGKPRLPQAGTSLEAA
jgi:hypothetical protein